MPRGIGDGSGGGNARCDLFTNTNPADPTATGTGFVPPYQYMLDPTSNFEAAIRAQVGPR